MYIHGEGRSEFGSPGEEVGEEGGRVLVISPATIQEEVGGPEEGGINPSLLKPSSSSPPLCLEGKGQENTATWQQRQHPSQVYWKARPDETDRKGIKQEKGARMELQYHRLWAFPSTRVSY